MLYDRRIFFFISVNCNRVLESVFRFKLSAWLHRRKKKNSVSDSLFFELGLNSSGLGLIFCKMSPRTHHDYLNIITERGCLMEAQVLNNVKNKQTNKEKKRKK